MWKCKFLHTLFLQLTDIRLRTFEFLVEPHSSDGTRSLVPMKHNRNYATCLIDRYKSNERLITRISNMQYKIVIYFLLTTDTDTWLDP